MNAAGVHIPGTGSSRTGLELKDTSMTNFDLGLEDAGLTHIPAIFLSSCCIKACTEGTC